MKNTLLSFVIFFSLIGFMLYSHNLLIKMCDEIIVICNKLEEDIKNNDFDESYNDSLSLINRIEQSESPIAIYINHSDLDYILNEASKLSQYIKFKSTSDALASVSSIKIYTTTIKQLQIPTLQNIF